MTAEHGTKSTDPRMARLWRIHWLQIEPTIRRYQVAVPLSRVLTEHHAAIAAEPLEEPNHVE